VSHADDFEEDKLEGSSELDADEQAELENLLRAALSPRELDPELHERILESALADPLAPANDEERARAERLREALENDDGSDDAALARALRFAHGASDAKQSEAAHETALARALPRRNNVVYAMFGAVGGALALAAAFALVVVPAQKRSAPSPDTAALARSRSLSPVLNAEASRLTASERMDRIASVREKDLRNNRYARWGVR
jgi:hypothetical protein